MKMTTYHETDLIFIRRERGMAKNVDACKDS